MNCRGPLRGSRSIQPGMLVLLDRGFHSARLIQVMRAMRAHVLGRLPSQVVPRYLRQLSDGTYLAYLSPEDDTGKQLGRPLLLRILDYRIEDAQRPGHGELHRLVTTLLNPRTVGARELILCSHERWEIETAIDDIDTHQRLCDYTLRSQTPEGVEQELDGVLLGYYAVRALMLQAAEQVGLDSDRLSFTHAITLVTDAIHEFQQTAQQQREDLTQRLLGDLREPWLPPRGYRSNPRVCKQAGSRIPAHPSRTPARAQTAARLRGGDRAGPLLDSLPRAAALQALQAHSTHCSPSAAALQAHSTHRSPYLNGIGPPPSALRLRGDFYIALLFLWSAENRDMLRARNVR